MGLNHLSPCSWVFRWSSSTRHVYFFLRYFTFFHGDFAFFAPKLGVWFMNCNHPPDWNVWLQGDFPFNHPLEYSHAVAVHPDKSIETDGFLLKKAETLQNWGPWKPFCSEFDQFVCLVGSLGNNLVSARPDFSTHSYNCRSARISMIISKSVVLQWWSWKLKKYINSSPSWLS